MAITVQQLEQYAALVEDSSRRFLARADSLGVLAAEMAAFANSDGGILCIGVQEDGTLSGLPADQVQTARQSVDLAARLHVRTSLHVQVQSSALSNGNTVLAVTVPEGRDKPYFTSDGVLWVKQAAGRQRVCTRSDLRPFFPGATSVHEEELSTKVGMDALNMQLLLPFLHDTLGHAFLQQPDEQIRLLQTLSLAADDGNLTLAGLLLFGEHPEHLFPRLIVLADSQDDQDDRLWQTQNLSGPLPVLFQKTLAFIQDNLHTGKERGDSNESGNSGASEIPAIVFEELLANALIHRDYLADAPIRIVVAADRVEIINPGILPPSLTTTKIRYGSTSIRYNPIIANCAARGLLPFHGQGGIRNALAAWPDISFEEDMDRRLFRVIVHRALSVQRARNA